MPFRPTRREFLETGALALFTSAAWPALSGCGHSSAGGLDPVVTGVEARYSAFGFWSVEEGLPVFIYDADHETLPEAEWDPIIRPRTRRHWHMFGNRAIQVQADNNGTVAVFDESNGLRWITAPDPRGTGTSSIRESDGSVWSSDFTMRAGESIPRRVFGPTHLEVRDRLRGLEVRRTIVCPEGDTPWLLVRVQLRLDRGAPSRSFSHIERWELRPRFVNLFIDAVTRRETAEREVSYQVNTDGGSVHADERFANVDGFNVFGPPASILLETLGSIAGTASATGEPHPTLEVETPLTLAPGEEAVLYFRFGHDDGTEVGDPSLFLSEQRRRLAERLPRADAAGFPEAAQEIPWHVAALTGGSSVDHVIGGHTLNQASTYSFEIGFNAAARDPLQHALPLVYTEPALALSVLRNTSAWATPDGDLPYSLEGAKQPFVAAFRPSDSNLWALWLASEYAAATGDLAAFDAPLDYHPRYGVGAEPLREHLRRQFRFFVDFVGRGERNHVRILNADWNDLAIDESGVERELMIERGSSVLNSAMASWVLAVFAGLADRLGESATAREARQHADDLRVLVASAWNGRWFQRAYAPGGATIGDDDCWLEVQPWAILCGAATPEQARSLIANIDANHRAGSPVGARVKWPANPDLVEAGIWGLGTLGGTWFAIDMTLVWAAAAVDREVAWDAWRRMTLGAHTAAYPGIWEGTLSGPDSWNGPESPRAGRTWVLDDQIAMQAFPVANLHSHAQPVLSYLRLLGVGPQPDGSLGTGTGGKFASRTFELAADGHGRLSSAGEVTVSSAHGTVRGAKGELRW